MSLAPIDGGAGHPARARTLYPFETLAPPSWGEDEPPAYDWIVNGCFLPSTVAMLSGDGGLGKSLIMQQLCTAASIGKQWLGLETKRCKSFAMFCEDDRDELWRRQARINRHYGVPMGDLDNVIFAPRAGLENVLMEFHKGDDKGKRTPIFDQLCHTVRDFGAQIIVIDTVADTFGGNEIIRSHVRRFIVALRGLAMEMHGVVILTAHPSNTGLSTGTGLSGSTGWNNSVRSRLYLTRPKRRPEDEGDDVDDNNERLLRTMKNNSAAAGGKVPLRWENGVFVRSDGGSAPVGFVAGLDMQRHILEAARALINNGVQLAADHRAPNSLANRVRESGPCKAYRWATVVAAQDKMTADGKLVRVTIGPPSKARIYIRPADTRYPSEPEAAGAPA